MKNIVNKQRKTIVNWYRDQLNTGSKKNEKLGWPKKNGFHIRYKVMSEIINEKNKKLNILDFGCGFSGLYEHQLKKNKLIRYTGVDAIDFYIKYGKKKYPKNHYLDDDLSELIKKKKRYDYTFLNGLFTVKRNINQKDMFKYIKWYLKNISKITKKGIAVNFMSNNVDWKRKDLFHLPLDPLVSFIIKNITRNFVIRNDYNLYEYTIYIYK